MGRILGPDESGECVPRSIFPLQEWIENENESPPPFLEISKSSGVVADNPWLFEGGNQMDGRLKIGDLMRNAPIIHRFEALGLLGYLPS